jgi:general secretion pathway protein D
MTRTKTTSVRGLPTLLLLNALLVLGGCASDLHTREAARDLIQQGDYEESIKLVEAALEKNPESVQLRVQAVAARQKAITAILDQLRQELGTLRFEDAKKTLVRARALDANDPRVAEAGLEVETAISQNLSVQTAQALFQRGDYNRTAALISEALKSNPKHAGLLGLKAQVLARQRSLQVQAAQTGLAESRPISLDFQDAGLRSVLDVVSRSSGLNFILDKDVKGDTKVTVYLRQTKLEDALDLITSTNQLAKKVLDSKTVLIYPNTPEKQKEYLEQAVRVFQLTSSNAKDAAGFLKSMLKPRNELFVDERSNMLALRDSADNIAIAERLIATFDSGTPEVLLDVQVLEVTRTRLTALGIKAPTTFSLTPLASSGGTGVGGSAALTLSRLANLHASDIGVGMAGVTINAQRQVGDVATLANPQIRARSREKASILIGDKIPVVTSTSGNGGFVSDSVTYLDVGVKLNVEPTVYANDQVAIKVQLEVSSLGNTVKTSSGTLAYQIGTRNAETLLQLQDGETQLLGGLFSKNDSTSADRLPGLGDLPGIGRLFSSTTDTNNKTELVLAITPHILRNVHQLSSSEAETWVGTDTFQRLRSVNGIMVDTPPATSTGSPDSTLGPGQSAPQLMPARTEAGSMASPAITVRLDETKPAKQGELLDLVVKVQSSSPLRGIPLDIRFDPTALEFQDAQEGDYFKQGSVVTSFSKSGDAKNGLVTLAVIRNQTSGVTGEGTAFLLKFKPLRSGVHSVAITRAAPLTLGAPASVVPLPPPLTITVQ